MFQRLNNPIWNVIRANRWQNCPHILGEIALNKIALNDSGPFRFYLSVTSVAKIEVSLPEKVDFLKFFFF